MLAISYSFNTNKPSKAGMKFSFVEVDKPCNASRSGPAFNGVTPSETQTVTNSTEALEFLTACIGRTWPEWSLLWMMPEDGSEPFYRIIARALPNAAKKWDGCRMQVICGRTPNGEIDAMVDL